MTPESALGPRIKRISNAIDRKRTLDMEDMELTSSQGMVLGYLARNPDRALSPGDVGRHFGLSHPTVTGILQRLEAKGFVTYAADPADRRRKQVLATEKALDCHSRIRERFLENEDRLTKGMSEAERTRLLELLDRVIENMGAACECCAGSPGQEEAK